jgi:hypothetical protein
MATFDYSTQVQQQRVQPNTAQPPCYTDERYYDPTSRDCRSCSWQNSCRDSIEAKRRSNNLSQVGQGPAVNNFRPQPVPSPFIVTPPQNVQNQPQPNMWANPYQQQPQPQQPGGVFRWPNLGQYGAPQYANPAQVPRPNAQVFQTTQTQYTFKDEQYGRVQDPLYHTISATPVPMRPQFAGETFTERLTKNVALHLMEVFLTQLLLGVRQMFMPPSMRE